MRNLGLTLIELLIYVVIVAAVLFLMIGFLWGIVLGNIKEISYQEVQQNARFVLTRINQEIKKATGVNSPNPGESSNVLSLAMSFPLSDPTVIDVVDGKLRITKGTSEPKQLTSDMVLVSGLRFTNLSYPNTPGTIRIEITIKRINPGSRIEYEAAIDSKTNVSLVPGGAAAPAAIKFEFYNVGDNASLGIRGWNVAMAQIFTVGTVGAKQGVGQNIAHRPAFVRLKLSRVPGRDDGVPDLIVSVQGLDVNSFPDGVDLCAGTIPVASVESTDWYEVSLTGGNCLLNPDTSYALVLTGPGMDWPDAISWRSNFGTGTYPGGSRARYGGPWPPTWSFYDNDDYMFEVWGYPI